MRVEDALAQARDTLTVRRVFGEAYERNGSTVIPVAAVRGGAGGGEGESPEGEGGQGSGAGFGVVARPVGALIVRGDDVVWRPTPDVTRIAIGAQVTLVAALLTLRSMAKTRAKLRTVQAMTAPGATRGRRRPRISRRADTAT